MAWSPRYIGCAVKNINSFFFRNRLNAQSLLKKVRAKACRHASKNLTEFRLFTGVQHTNGFRFTAIDSSANNQRFWLGFSFVAADVAAFHAWRAQFRVMLQSPVLSCLEV